MGKFVFIDDDGVTHEIREVEQTQGDGALVITMSYTMRDADIEKIEQKLRERTGRDIIVLGAQVDKVMQING